jgi:hypothetical protein
VQNWTIFKFSEILYNHLIPLVEIQWAGAIVRIFYSPFFENAGKQGSDPCGGA